MRRRTVIDVPRSANANAVLWARVGAFTCIHSTRRPRTWRTREVSIVCDDALCVCVCVFYFEIRSWFVSNQANKELDLIRSIVRVYVCVLGAGCPCAEPKWGTSCVRVCNTPLKLCFEYGPRVRDKVS